MNREDLDEAINEGKKLKYLPKCTVYELITTGIFKTPGAGWFELVSYTDGKEIYNRLLTNLDDFEIV